MSTLNRAIEIAVDAHSGQVDKAGMPYILHPLRVMLAQDNEETRIVAVLHDVVEDSDWCLEDLADEGFSPTVVAAVDALTRRQDGRSYLTYVQAISGLALPVKIADLKDNLDPKRPCPSHLAERYRNALHLLGVRA